MNKLFPYQMEPGTRFWVHNGHWTGRIFEKEGVKYLHVEETNEDHDLTNQQDKYVTVTILEKESNKRGKPILARRRKIKPKKKLQSRKLPSIRRRQKL